jgi:uncharacterized protein
MRGSLALFPLRTVLFPHGRLPLRIFERRYVDMVRGCLRDGEPFGVVLIRSGAEVGEVTALAELGTSARIADFGQLPDGLLSIVAQGERRFRLLAREVQPDGLHRGDVEWLDDAASPLAPQAFAELRRLLAEALDELGDRYPAGEPRYDDALWVSSQLAQILPTAPEFRQQLLELPDAAERLALLERVRTASRLS